MENKYCSNCGAEIDSKAEICPKCGVRQKGTYIIQEKNPGVAAVLSALWVGLGQIYNGEIGKGILLMVVYTISAVLMVLIIGFITTPILWVYGVYDAYNSAKMINSGEKIV
ncbi:MAG: zinc ribbon domain-containing protein [Methanobacteriaceae archaeon]|nr:zinc ribbon domain-containing protein [Methanobacteriaceae archaeon]